MSWGNDWSMLNISNSSHPRCTETTSSATLRRAHGVCLSGRRWSSTALARKCAVACFTRHYYPPHRLPSPLLRSTTHRTNNRLRNAKQQLQHAMIITICNARCSLLRMSTRARSTPPAPDMMFTLIHYYLIYWLLPIVYSLTSSKISCWCCCVVL